MKLEAVYLSVEEKKQMGQKLNVVKSEIEKALEKGLDNALLVCYGNTIKSLVDRNLKICKTTIDIYNKLLSEL